MDPNREKVMRCIIQPMRDRGWTPPTDGSLDVVIEDFVRLLGRYPEDMLSRAFDEVLVKHRWKSWPLVGSFVEACQERREGGSPIVSSDEQDRIDRSRKAIDYAKRRELADGGATQIRAMKGLYIRELRAFLFQRACDDLRAGRDPYIPQAEFDHEIQRLEGLT
jgi:hypothetical protein